MKDKDYMAEIGQKGGEATANKYGSSHYAEIGKKGGKTVSSDKDHMAEIGRLGAQKRWKNHVKKGRKDSTG